MTVVNLKNEGGEAGAVVDGEFAFLKLLEAVGLRAAFFHHGGDSPEVGSVARSVAGKPFAEIAVASDVEAGLRRVEIGNRDGDGRACVGGDEFGRGAGRAGGSSGDFRFHGGVDEGLVLEGLSFVGFALPSGSGRRMLGV
jgi:hypothetical protein